MELMEAMVAFQSDDPLLCVKEGGGGAVQMYEHWNNPDLRHLQLRLFQGCCYLNRVPSHTVQSLLLNITNQNMSPCKQGRTHLTPIE